MFKKVCFFLCCSFALLASSPLGEKVSSLETETFWKYHHSASMGYRRDRQRFAEINTKTAYTDRNSLELILNSHLQWHKIVFHVRGSYGWLLNGDFDFSAPGNSFGDPLFFGKYDLGAGYAADAAGELGLRIEFINCPNFAVSLIPMGGYAYSHLMNFSEGENRFALPDTTSFALARFPNPNQQDWFGPFVEGRLEFLFWQRCEWSLFYQYHWSAVRSKSKEEIDLYLFNPVALELFRSNSIYEASNVQKQLAGTDFRYRTPSSGWYFGAHFEGSSAWTHKARYHSKRSREQFILAPTGTTTIVFNESASIHWVCYEVSLSLGYQF